MLTTVSYVEILYYGNPVTQVCATVLLPRQTRNQADLRAPSETTSKSWMFVGDDVSLSLQQQTNIRTGRYNRSLAFTTMSGATAIPQRTEIRAAFSKAGLTKIDNDILSKCKLSVLFWQSTSNYSVAYIF
jgi:hypothetical protein